MCFLLLFQKFIHVFVYIMYHFFHQFCTHTCLAHVSCQLEQNILLFSLVWKSCLFPLHLANWELIPTFTVDILRPDPAVALLFSFTRLALLLLMAKPNAIVKALFSCLSHIQFAPFSNWEIISIFDSVFMLLLLSSSIFLLSICNCNHLHIYAYVCIFCKYL